MNQKLSISLGIGLVVLAVFLIGKNQWVDNAEPRDASSLHVKTRIESSDVIKSYPTERQSKSPQDPLDHFKVRWSAVKSESGQNNKSAVESLVLETVRSLKCSDEMIQLLNFLDEQGLEVMRSGVENELIAQLKGGHSSDFRESLLRSGRLGQFKRSWTYYAGVGCPAAEAESFALDLGNDAQVLHFKYGYNSKLASEDPENAIQDTLEIIPSEVLDDDFDGAFPYGGPVNYSATVLRDIVEMAPADSDFSSIERFLPPDRDNDSNPVNQARNAIITRWARQNVIDAVDYVINHPERAKASSIKGIASASRERLESVLEHISGLDKSPRLDAIIAEIASSLGPGERDLAGLFVGRISNSEVKREAQSKVIQVQSAGRMRE